jgi:hypothetical protein
VDQRSRVRHNKPAGSFAVDSLHVTLCLCHGAFIGSQQTLLLCFFLAPFLKPSVKPNRICGRHFGNTFFGCSLAICPLCSDSYQIAASEQFAALCHKRL